jgi:hypothetical protein
VIATFCILECFHAYPDPIVSQCLDYSELWVLKTKILIIWW